MNILFLTMSQFDSIDIYNIYSDLMPTFIGNGHRPYIVSPYEKRFAQETELFEFSDYSNLKVKVGNMSNVSLIEKGLSTLRLGRKFYAAINKYFSKVKFDLILYSTPPITLAGVVKKQKARQHAATYLLLKDIFPQNAVDLGMMREGGLLHRYFRRKEKQLYALSDHIGCMSDANVDYLLEHNPEVASEKVGVSPNSIIPKQIVRAEKSRQEQREKYGIPLGAVIFIYGGNMGAPQDIPFVVQCLKTVENRSDCFFIMCGTGNCYSVLEQYVKEDNPSNVLIINGLPKAEYDALLQACDVGLLFLDHRFTIPNFPSRMLSYMEQSMPILACTDRNTDVGKVIADGGFGWWCESRYPAIFKELCEEIIDVPNKYAEIGAAGRRYLEECYTADRCCRMILERIGLSTKENT
ncbi:MAG: glycosyltransferase WbuB [Firmicutes bacterium HGW-Firmicutes-16]|nr:MAG: glycosyltransferase WbuB [Firmicutes bacterium HGW-Firmicutes-16]